MKIRSHKIRLIDLGETEWWLTQAVYHALAERMQVESAGVVVLCRPRSPYLCLGYHQVLDDIFDRKACNRLRLPVIRRRVGGGATYLDSDQLFYQFIFHQSRVPIKPEQMYAEFLELPVAALRAVGVPAQLVGLNEIEVNERRVAGIGGGQIGEACVVVGNFLFDFDFETLAAVWRCPTPAFEEMAREALRVNIATLRELAPSVTMPALQEAFLRALQKKFGPACTPSALTAKERKHAETVYRRLRSPAFLNLHAGSRTPNGRSSLKISGREEVINENITINGTSVCATLRVRDGVIRQAHIRGKLSSCALERMVVGELVQNWKTRISRAV